MTDSSVRDYEGANVRTTTTGWTAGRVTAVVVGALLSLVALTLIGGGAAAAYYGSQDDGYIDLGTSEFAHRTDTYAMTTESWRADEQLGGLYDDLRITFKPDNASDPVFVGIADAGRMNQYLGGVQHVTIHDSSAKGDTQSKHEGGTPKTPPAQADVWVAKAGGQGAQTLNWTVKPGEVAAVAMKADGSRGLAGHVTVEARVGALAGIGYGLLAAGLIVLAGSLFLIVKPVRRARARTA
ncbi:hypothetical protein ACFVWY_26575 [Streptomyces sp. NPDC058195]|uniref:hypothetical protein n=1 Tax=Streptomyces sp. NPDC058195 TaxID=3346375 RepID=UPI0036F155E7